jgi:hypothetical protein
MRAWFYVGAIRQQWKDRKQPQPVAAKAAGAMSAGQQPENF